MKYLSEVDYRLFEALTIRRLHARKIYFCVKGRNAWHSTWIKRYSEGCMHTTLASAKTFCESKRGYGNVFYVEELPALVAEHISGSVVVTQINCDNVLGDYSPDALSTRPPFGSRLIDGSKNNYLSRSSNLLGFCLSFDRDSRFWKSKPPKADSVIVLKSTLPFSDFAPLPDELGLFTSKSDGVRFLLSWTRKTGKIKPYSILWLASLSQDSERLAKLQDQRHG